jgi:hypothetical protein
MACFGELFCGAYLLLGVAGIALVLVGLFRLGRSFASERVIRLIWSSSLMPYDTFRRDIDRTDGIFFIVIGGVLLGVFFLISCLVIIPMLNSID